MPTPLRRTLWRDAYLAGLVLLAVLAGGALPARAGTNVSPLDGGGFHIALGPAHNWTSDPKPAQGCILFQYTDRPALTTAATIGVFRIVVPPEARTAEHAELAAAYATYDLSGAQQALFKSRVQFVPLSKKPKSVHGGQLLSFGDRLDANNQRIESTRFLRAWVFFPPSFSRDGVLYFVLGKEECNFTQVRPSVLEYAEEIVAAIQ